MMTKAFLYVMLTACIVEQINSAGWWMDQPYEDAEAFNLNAEYEQNYTLECSDDRVNGGEFRHWIRPDLTVMVNDDSEYFKTLDGDAGWRVEDNKMILEFVQEQHFGFYYCLLYDAPNYIYVKKGVNYQGPYFGDLWDKYEMNVIVGCSAAGGFLLACLIIYVVHHFFFDNGMDFVDEYEDVDRKAEDSSYNPNLAISYPNAYVNNGYMMNETKKMPYVSEYEDITQL